ncbi:DUF350 domain-containing protein [Stieleria sp. TO1_6]|uniref:DUF350 domain-containing protein n=1 Tax=Stieleria tagensis TaxID=2956795 RepID=UPI00209B16ED|nr:DUF350 domain-containing protein [Stieleria tagensis]MCO8122805.1 DUF350 domain-containing protein [Stieleria tagensis]
MKSIEMMMPLAQQQQMQSRIHLLGEHLVAALVFSLLGIVVFFLCLLVMEKLTHFSIVKEIGEEHNMAVAMVVGSIVLGISFIIAAAIVG